MYCFYIIVNFHGVCSYYKLGSFKSPAWGLLGEGRVFPPAPSQALLFCSARLPSVGPQPGCSPSSHTGPAPFPSCGHLSGTHGPPSHRPHSNCPLHQQCKDQLLGMDGHWSSSPAQENRRLSLAWAHQQPEPWRNFMKVGTRCVPLLACPLLVPAAGCCPWHAGDILAHPHPAIQPWPLLRPRSREPAGDWLTPGPCYLPEEAGLSPALAAISLSVNRR